MLRNFNSTEKNDIGLLISSLRQNFASLFRLFRATFARLSKCRSPFSPAKRFNIIGKNLWKFSFLKGLGNIRMAF